jgi:hypothetical protein
LLQTVIPIAVSLIVVFSTANAYANGYFITVTPPQLLDTAGNKLISASTGQLVVVSTAIVNTTPAETPFVVFIEARDEQGVTVYSQFGLGTIDTNQRSEIGQSWSPDHEGKYQFRAFAINNFTNYAPLSTIVHSEIMVTP